MKYPHTCTVTRTTETISTTGGVPVSGSTSTLYSGKCDAQENSRQFNVQNGFVASKGSVTVFIPASVQEKGIKHGDSITVTWANGDTSTGRIESTDNLEDTFIALYS